MYVDQQSSVSFHHSVSKQPRSSFEKRVNARFLHQLSYTLV